MPIDMANQFKGLPMGDLIGGPLMAACDAQVRLANATATFIQQVGFVPPPGADLADATYDPTTFDVRTVSFKFNRPSLSKDIVSPGEVNPMETVELDVPLLAIVKIPALSIDLVDITFDMEVKSTETTEDTSAKSGSVKSEASVGWGPFAASVSIEGSVSSSQKNTRTTDQSAKYHVQVTARDTGMPEGLARVLDLMNSAIAPTAITQPVGSPPLVADDSDDGAGSQRRGRKGATTTLEAGKHYYVKPADELVPA